LSKQIKAIKTIKATRGAGRSEKLPCSHSQIPTAPDKWGQNPWGSCPYWLGIQ